MSDDTRKQFMKEMSEASWRVILRLFSTFAYETLRSMGTTGRLVLLLWHILGSTWLLTVAVLSTVMIFGSYVVITLQALWSPVLGMADILLPVKVALLTGYGVLFFHVGRRLYASLRGKEPTGALATLFELALFIGPLIALRTSISEFLGRGSFIYLGEGVLPWEVRTISTFAYILPVAVLLAAFASMGIMLKIGQVIVRIRRGIEKVPPEKVSEMIDRMDRLLDKWKEIEPGRVQSSR